MEQKMKRVAWLLTRSHLRIGEIAAMLHFCDDNNISGAFKKYLGMTPRQYRKILLHENTPADISSMYEM